MQTRDPAAFPLVRAMDPRFIRSHMDDSLAIIFQFLAQFEPAVFGHAEEPKVEPAMVAQLRLFARGALPMEQREALIQHLQADPFLLVALAEEVKALRSSSHSADGPTHHA